MIRILIGALAGCVVGLCAVLIAIMVYCAWVMAQQSTGTAVALALVGGCSLIGAIWAGLAGNGAS